jgi:hypothetical protein
VRVLLGNGDGTLQAPVATTLNLQAGMGVGVTDINADKKADLLLSLFDSSNPNNLSLNVLLGNGDGTFGAPKLVVSGPQPLFAIADFNKDGKPDLGVIHSGGAQTLLGRGDGTFQIGVTVAGADGFDGGRVWATDVNGDGNMDLIVDSGQESCGVNGSCGTQHVGVYLAGIEGFGNQQIFAEGFFNRNSFNIGSSSLVGDLVTGDFNGDGKVDVVDRRTSSSSFPPTTKTVLEVRLGKGDGTFAPNNANFDPTLSLADPGSLLLAQDLNGDQLADLVVAEANAVSVLLNGTPAFSISASAMALIGQAGQQVTDSLSFTEHNGFSSVIQLSCQVNGPAPLPTCSLSPASVGPNVTSSTSTLTVKVPASSAGLFSHSHTLYALAFPLALLVAPFGISRRNRCKRWLLWTALAAVALVFTACGGGGSKVEGLAVHQMKSYTVVVTAASNPMTKSLEIPLTVQ